MIQNLPSQISNWLYKLEIKVSRNYLKDLLLSHPDYPSLASITDVLDELRIENTAIEIEKEQLSEISIPLTGHNIPLSF